MENIILRNFKPIGFHPMPKFSKGDLSIDQNGNISAIEMIGKIKVVGSAREINIDGCYLSPGWIDLHTHVYYGVGDIGVCPSEVGPSTGTVMLVDAGSSGESNFKGFKEYIVDKNEFPIKSLLNISTLGMPDGTASHLSELMGWGSINLNRLLTVCNNNRNIIKGIKLRASKNILRDLGMEAVNIAVNVATLCKLPLFVHIGEPPAFLSDLMEILRPGDIITHSFNGKIGNNVVCNKNLLKFYQKGIDKGIRFDIGHGSSSFSFAAARILINSNILPYSISTDIHALNLNGPVYDLATTMSKMLAVGMNIDQVIDCVTENPAQFLQQEGWTKLEVGQKAFLTGFELHQGNFTLTDSNSTSDGPVAMNGYESLIVDRIVNPVIAFYGNNYCKSESRLLRLNKK
ncbi:MAG TPA: amidohydrolase/deacetylase family metallohydrolase [Atribacterota bacterium]|nr:amidohydrolase/deacetylase family metallohydrolase [Atribacterota bacterium]